MTLEKFEKEAKLMVQFDPLTRFSVKFAQDGMVEFRATDNKKFIKHCVSANESKKAEKLMKWVVSHMVTGTGEGGRSDAE